MDINADLHERFDYALSAVTASNQQVAESLILLIKSRQLVQELNTSIPKLDAVLN